MKARSRARLDIKPDQEVVIVGCDSFSIGK